VYVTVELRAITDNGRTDGWTDKQMFFVYILFLTCLLYIYAYYSLDKFTS